MTFLIQTYFYFRTIYSMSKSVRAKGRRAVNFDKPIFNKGLHLYLKETSVQLEAKNRFPHRLPH